MSGCHGGQRPCSTRPLCDRATFNLQPEPEPFTITAKALDKLKNSKKVTAKVQVRLKDRYVSLASLPMEAKGVVKEVTNKVQNLNQR